MTNLLVLDAAGTQYTIKSTNTASVETVHHNSQLMVGNAHVTNTNALPVNEGEHVWTTVWGVLGVPVTNADCHTTACNVTDAPTSGQKLVVDDIFFSLDIATTVTFKCETSGTVILGPINCSGNTPYHISPRRSKGWKLATADKKLTVSTNVAANVTVMVGYHSEA